MRGCVRSCSRGRRPQHHPEPSAGPAFACPVAAGSVPATVSPKQLPLRGQVNLCGRLLLLFLLLSQLLLLLPLRSRSEKPLTQLTLARLRAVSPARLPLASRAPPRRWTHLRDFSFPQSRIALHSLCPAATSLPLACPAAPQPPPGAAP